MVLNPDGSFTYTPNPGFTGMDTFCYEICDDGMPSLCDTACVIIDVIPDLNDTLNDPPFAQDDANSTVVNIAVSGDMSPNDVDPNGDSLVYNTIPVTGPANGMVTINGDGTYTYTPDAGYYGPDQFTYSVCDTAGLCDTATVYLTVLPVAPNAVDDINNTVVDIPTGGNILTNDDNNGLTGHAGYHSGGRPGQRDDRDQPGWQLYLYTGSWLYRGRHRVLPDLQCCDAVRYSVPVHRSDRARGG